MKRRTRTRSPYLSIVAQVVDEVVLRLGLDNLPFTQFMTVHGQLTETVTGCVNKAILQHTSDSQDAQEAAIENPHWEGH